MGKIYSAVLLFSMVAASAFSQQLPFVKIHGRIINQENGTPISGQIVYISIDSLLNHGHSSKAVTDANGVYIDSVLYMSGSNPQKIDASTYDCRGVLVINSTYFQAGKLEVIIDFKICSDINTRCEAFFTNSPNPDNVLQVAFYDESRNLTGAGKINYLWNFGDGSVSTDQIAVHSYAKPGIYNVCLTIKSSDNLCSSTFCLSDSVGTAIPVTCENYFNYQPDSSGTTFAFAGIAKNTQISSWSWDFGDGTTANGQSVLHSFTGTNISYTVCLTTSGINADGTLCSTSSCQVIYLKIPTPCENYFKVNTLDNSTYSFSGNVSANGPAYYYWNFGDGDTATGQQVTHTFNGPIAELFYNVCLTTILAIPGATGFDECKSISCQEIYPEGDSSCHAVMSAQADSSGYTFRFENLSQFNTGFTVWNFGDGAESSQKNPSHFYQNPGIYTACLTIIDSLNKCWDKTCQEIWVNAVQHDCQASFYAYSSDSSSESLSYVFLNTSSAGYAKQKWSFGDGMQSSELKPIHTFSVPGIYTACLTIWDSTGFCQNTYCMEIYTGKANGEQTIRGIVLAGKTPADEGLVWLIGAGNNYHAEVLIDSTGSYNFSNVPSGSFYIYAMLTPGSKQFFNFLPTYYANSLIWQNAIIIVADKSDKSYTINLIPGVTGLNGDAVISGNVNWVGTDGNVGKAAAGVEIVLFNSNGVPVAYTFSDSEGNFTFNNLPYGNYTLHGKMAGKITGTANVNLSGISSNAKINFVITFEEILTAINEPGKLNLATGNPYPNPVKETLNFDLNSATPKNVEVEIVDIQGRSIHLESIEISGGINHMQIATGNLIKGMYLLRIISEGHKIVQRKFIK